jgi:hypothetical protein
LTVIISLVALFTFSELRSTHAESGKVTLVRTPSGGIQPQALVDEGGALHLIYFTGDPAAGDVFYVRRESGKTEFSSPLRVNSQPGSVVAGGTVRGAQMALGKNGRVHVAWFGSQKSEPRGPGGSAPMVYSRLDDSRKAFEAQRNLMQFSGGLDGGGSVAADRAGNVYVVWHGRGEKEGESHRRVWVSRSTDDGKSFTREVAAYKEETGACGCCGMRAFADERGDLYLMYRAATEMINRGMFLLVSRDKGKSFRGVSLDQWKLTTCPMSTVSISRGEKAPMAAWENDGQVSYAPLDASLEQKVQPITAPGETGKRKHPVISGNAQGETALVWTEGTGWKRGGSLSWQIFDHNGRPVGDVGTAPGIAVWSFAAVFAERNGQFTIIY